MVDVNIPEKRGERTTGVSSKNHATFSGLNDGHGFLVLIDDKAPKMWDVRKNTIPQD